MISSVLIANRGEIAVRIIRAAKEMRIKTILVHSKADKESLAVKMADRSVCIGPAPASESYLFYQNILTVATALKVDAIHPGYGFLSENPLFAEACRAIKVKFIGPKSNIIRNMGDKAKAKAMMESSGVPVVPGSHGDIESFNEACEVAERIGFPLIIKASAGGGGKGMRIVTKKKDLEKGFHSAATEAQKSFADARVYVEKYIASPKHIEVQILGDRQGNVVHLFERDCSIQRRHQKLLEEAPAANLDKDTRKKMCEVAVKAAKSAGYDSAGTIEYLYDQEANEFYFMEMNTRIQVEHPISEEITGIDLVKQQFKIANGEKLSMSQEDIERKGHAIECRINAEDPDNDFRPTPGKITQYIVPGGPGIRVDSGVYPGYTIPPYYDSLIAKVIAWGSTRREALDRMRRALAEFNIEGVKSTIPFHRKILHKKEFLCGKYNTDFVEKYVG